MTVGPRSDPLFLARQHGAAHLDLPVLRVHPSWPGIEPGGGGPRPPAEDDTALPRPGEEIDLRAILRLLRRRAGMIALLTLSLLAVLIPLILSMERVYSARLRLLVQRPAAYDLAGTEAESLGPFDLDTEIERLVSQANVLAVIDHLDLDRLEEFAPEATGPSLTSRLVAEASARLGLSVPLPEVVEAPPEPPLTAFYDRLSVRRSGATSVIEIAFTSLDPALAAEVPNDLVRVYLDRRAEQAGAETSRARDWLDGRIAAQRDRIAGLDASLAALRDGSGPISESDQTVAVYRLAALNDRLSEIASTRSDLNAALAQLAAGTRAPQDIEDGYAPLLAGLRQDLLARTRDYTRLVEQFGDAHVLVVQRQGDVDEARAALATEVEGLVSALRNRLGTLDEEEADLTVQVRNAAEALATMTRSGQRASALEADLDRERTTLAGLEDRLRTVDGLGMLPVAEVEVLSPASRPIGPDGRGRKFYAALALVGALCIAVTAAFLRELTDRSLRSLQQLSAIPGSDPAGLLPELPWRGPASVPARLSARRAAAFRDAVHDLALALETDREGRLPGSILVTAALQGQGTSLVAMALALHLAATGRQVLLVDAAAGRLHAQFGVRAEPGLLDLLERTEPPAEPRIVHVAPRLELIPRGTLGLDGHRDMERIREVLARAARSGTVVVIDGPPVLADADALHLAGLVERRLLVVRWARVPRRLVDLAVARLARRGGGGVGVVLNRVNPRRHARYSFSDSDLFLRPLRSYRRHNA